MCHQEHSNGGRGARAPKLIPQKLLLRYRFCSEDLSVGNLVNAGVTAPAAEIPSTGLRAGLFFREKDPKPFPPRSATFNRADASPRRSDQLAGLRQGPQIVLSVSPVGRSAGGGQVEPLHLFRWPLSPVPYIGSKDGCRLRLGSMRETKWMPDYECRA